MAANLSISFTQASYRAFPPLFPLPAPLPYPGAQVENVPARGRHWAYFPSKTTAHIASQASVMTVYTPVNACKSTIGTSGANTNGRNSAAPGARNTSPKIEYWRGRHCVTPSLWYNMAGQRVNCRRYLPGITSPDQIWLIQAIREMSCTPFAAFFILPLVEGGCACIRRNRFPLPGKKHRCDETNLSKGRSRKRGKLSLKKAMCWLHYKLDLKCRRTWKNFNQRNVNFLSVSKWTYSLRQIWVFKHQQGTLAHAISGQFLIWFHQFEIKSITRDYPNNLQDFTLLYSQWMVKKKVTRSKDSTPWLKIWMIHFENFIDKINEWGGHGKAWGRFSFSNIYKCVIFPFLGEFNFNDIRFTIACLIVYLLHVLHATRLQDSFMKKNTPPGPLHHIQFLPRPTGSPSSRLIRRTIVLPLTKLAVADNGISLRCIISNNACSPRCRSDNLHAVWESGVESPVFTE